MQVILNRLSKEQANFEREAFRLIITYLVFNRFRPDACTLRRMERELCIPYTRLRSLMKRLLNDKIVEQIPVGTAKAFRIVDMQRVIQKNYISFNNRSDLEKIAIMASPIPALINGVLMDDILLWSMPIFKTKLPIEKQIFEYISERWEKTVVAIRHLYARGKINQKLPRELRDFALELKNWGDLGHCGLFPLLYIPFVRTTQFCQWVISEIEPDILLTLKREYNLQRHSVNVLSFFPYANPFAILLREITLLNGHKKNLSKKEVIEACIKIIENQLRFLLRVIKPLYKKIENCGVEALTDKDNTLTKETILYETIPLRYAALLTLILGGDKKLARRGRMVSDILSCAVKNNYRGKKTEKTTLKCWYIKVCKG